MSFGGENVACAGVANCGRAESFGLSVGTMHGIFGFEEDVTYVSDFFGSEPGESNAVLTIASNFMIRFPTPSRMVRPYTVFGLAFIRPHVTLDAAGFGNDKNTLGYNVGGGVELNLLRRFGFRSDLRRVRTFKDMSFGMFSTEQLDYWRGSAGLTLRF